MDLKQIERLMAVMGRTGMKKVTLRQEGFEIELERECAGGAMPYIAPSQMPLGNGGFNPDQGEGRPQQPVAEAAKDTAVGGQFVTSPMVGTFYAAPSPDQSPYAKVGDEVDENSVVCIIEAMKVMNEVKSGVRGKIVEILVKNGDPVEFGTKIMRIV